jgi:hypothetical protein
MGRLGGVAPSAEDRTAACCATTPLRPPPTASILRSGNAGANAGVGAGAGAGCSATGGRARGTAISMNGEKRDVIVAGGGRAGTGSAGSGAPSAVAGAATFGALAEAPPALLLSATAKRRSGREKISMTGDGAFDERAFELPSASPVCFLSSSAKRARRAAVATPSRTRAPPGERVATATGARGGRPVPVTPPAVGRGASSAGAGAGTSASAGGRAAAAAAMRAATALGGAGRAPPRAPKLATSKATPRCASAGAPSRAGAVKIAGDGGGGSGARGATAARCGGSNTVMGGEKSFERGTGGAFAECAASGARRGPARRAGAATLSDASNSGGSSENILLKRDIAVARAGVCS